METLLLVGVVALLIGFFLGKYFAKRDMDGLRASMGQEFENLANRIFENKSQTFRDATQGHMGLILSPFKDRLHELQEKVAKYRDDEMREVITLKSELKRMMEMNQRLGVEAENLTRALKGDVKAQGQWGELVLEKILEKSGLREGEEFTREASQMGLKDQDGKTQRPDVVIHLPLDKHLIVDSKVSLISYDRFIEGQDEADRSEFLVSLRTHVKGLSAKEYHHLSKLVTPEFVFMFIPIEGAFSLALQSDPELFSYAWDRKVILVSPTTLMVSLRTVENLWRQEKQNKNALEMARQAGELYDKFAGVVEGLTELRVTLEKSQRQHQEVMNRLSDGRGNLISRAEKLKELGAKTNKQIDMQ